MTRISKQLRKYFIFVTMLSIAFITIISNVSINLFFSGYIKESRGRDDLKVVQYVERVYGDDNELNSQSLMSIMHYALSEAVTVRIRDIQNNIIWSSGVSGSVQGMMGGNDRADNNLAYRNYSFKYKGNQIGSIDVGRPKSIISSIEDKQFLLSINAVFAVAFIFSILVAMISSSRISRRFLEPIYLIKENAMLIQDGKYKKLNEVRTNTFELYNLSKSVKELAERLEYQDTLRKRMTSDIAHELRTPLATVQSHIEAFMDGVWEASPEKLSIIHNEIFRLTKLIKDLSDLSIMESDEIKLNKSQFNLSISINNVIESFQLLFSEKNIHVQSGIQSDIELWGDADRLNQVFINLLSNAFKYTNRDGSVWISLEKQADVIRATVEDAGIGIPKEDIKHIFERFYRSDMSRNRGTGGTGIGLTITKAIIEAHDGRIRVESEEGKGTKVVIEFINIQGRV